MNDCSLSQKCPLFQGRPQETRLCLACSIMLLGMKMKSFGYLGIWLLDPLLRGIKKTTSKLTSHANDFAPREGSNIKMFRPLNLTCWPKHIFERQAQLRHRIQELNKIQWILSPCEARRHQNQFQTATKMNLDLFNSAILHTRTKLNILLIRLNRTQSNLMEWLSSVFERNRTLTKKF